MAGDHHAHRQVGDALQHHGHVVEAGFAVDLREDDAEAVFPQRIGADEHAMGAVEQHHRMRVVARCGQHLPAAAAGLQGLAGLQQTLR